MKKSTQEKINNQLDSLNRARLHTQQANDRVNKRLKRLIGGKTPIADIFNQAYKEKLNTVRKNLKNI